MTIQRIFETLPGEAIFAIPLAVLLTLVLLLLRRIAIKRAKGRRDTVAHAYAMPVDDVGAIATRIEAAKAGNNNVAVADLYLAQALAYQKLGDEKARMTALTAAAGYAALHGPESTHAIARMHLADAARSTGDLTSACEHWHLAREAFQASGHSEEYARVEKLMRENGCPTDWVLTEF